mmetsp:Transcript_41583/g.118942  ORF Transcript_41583/g.118942 Transcript_41583/m.118942 type:complete len:202 (-) Transcript_41583:201-806(-)
MDPVVSGTEPSASTTAGTAVRSGVTATAALTAASARDAGANAGGAALGASAAAGSWVDKAVVVARAADAGIEAADAVAGALWGDDVSEGAVLAVGPSSSSSVGDRPLHFAKAAMKASRSSSTDPSTDPSSPSTSSSPLGKGGASLRALPGCWQELPEATAGSCKWPSKGGGASGSSTALTTGALPSLVLAKALLRRSSSSL